MAQDTTNTRLRPTPGALRLDAAGAGALPLPGVAMPSRKALWTLGAVVLLGHLVLLQTLPEAIAPPDRFETRTFTTRTIVIAPPAPKAVEAVPAEPVPVAVAKPQPSRKVAKPKPRSAPAPIDSSETTAMQATAPPDPQPADPSTVEAPAMPDSAAQAPAPPASAPDAAQQAALPQTPASGAVVGPTDASTAPQTTASALTLAIPGSTRLLYKLTGERGERKKFPYYADGELLWRQDGQSYEARLEGSLLFVGALLWTSSGKITERGLAPQRYADRRQSSKSEVAAHFEREKGQVSFSANTPAAPLVNDMQDRLSVMLQVAAMIAGDPTKFPANTTFTLPVVGPRNAAEWTFTVQAEETINLPSGPMSAIKVTRNPRKQFDQTIEVWLAPGMAYMPVRIRLTEANADFVDMQFSSAGKP
jgi:hypothetical protein